MNDKELQTVKTAVRAIAHTNHATMLIRTSNCEEFRREFKRCLLEKMGKLLPEEIDALEFVADKVLGNSTEEMNEVMSAVRIYLPLRMIE